jgi:uncharacterized protein
MPSIPHTEQNEFIEKDYGQEKGSQADASDKMESQEALQRIRTAGSVSLSPELFEKLYLSPRNNVKGELRKTFGNPTPLLVIWLYPFHFYACSSFVLTVINRAIIGFLLSLTPLSCELMGWRGSGGSGSATMLVSTFQNCDQ